MTTANIDRLFESMLNEIKKETKKAEEDGSFECGGGIKALIDDADFKLYQLMNLDGATYISNKTVWFDTNSCCFDELKKQGPIYAIITAQAKYLIHPASNCFKTANGDSMGRTDVQVLSKYPQYDDMLKKIKRKSLLNENALNGFGIVEAVKGDIRTVIDTAGFKLQIPLTHSAAVELGKNTMWEISEPGRTGARCFTHNNERGPIYILEAGEKKYAIHPATDIAIDAHRNEISAEEIEELQRYPQYNEMLHKLGINSLVNFHLSR